MSPTESITGPDDRIRDTQEAVRACGDTTSREINHWMENLGVEGLSPTTRTRILETPPQWFLDQSGYEVPADCPLIKWYEMLGCLTRWFDQKREALGDEWIIQTPEAAFVYAVQKGVNLEREKENITMVKEAQKNMKPEKDLYHDDYVSNEEAIRENDRITAKLSIIRGILAKMDEKQRKNVLFSVYNEFSDQNTATFLKSLYKQGDPASGLRLIGDKCEAIQKYVSEFVGAN